jgi:DNA mismatch repair protein MLH1
MTVPQAIRLLYGHSIANQLLEAIISSEEQHGPDNDEEEEDAMKIDFPAKSTSWSAKLHFSNANYQAKKMIFLLFINRTWCLVNP